MNVIHTANELGSGSRKVCLAIGFFDGVHLGHQQIIRETIADARRHGAIALVVTFDRHPNTVVAPNRVPPLIYSLPRKLRVIEAMGADTLLLIHFDKAFSEQTGETFIGSLARDLGHIQTLCVGTRFTFGHKRSGDVALLRTLGDKLRFGVHAVSAVSLDGKPISSTRIREAIRAGELDLAGRMLGRTYSLVCRVVSGDHLGRQLGFPTANLDATGLALPPNGVYVAQAIVGDKRYRAVLNIGYRPTLEQSARQLRVEAHLLDFDSDLYDRELELIFVEKLRDEEKFASVVELRHQIARDIEQARSRF